MIYLLDVNVLLALAWPNHQFHHAATRWFGDVGGEAWATNAIVELGFVRLSSHPRLTAEAKTPAEAAALLRALVTHTGHRALGPLPALASALYGQALGRLTGHRQVTDALLLAHAEAEDAQLATFDRRIAMWAPWPSRVHVISPTGTASA